MSQTAQSARLTPSAKPTSPGLPWWLWAAGVLALGGGIAVWVKDGYEYFVNSSGAVGAMFSGIIILIGAFAIYSWRKQGFDREMPRWQRMMRLWNRLFYCARCDGVFVPGLTQLVPADSISKFLHVVSNTMEKYEQGDAEIRKAIEPLIKLHGSVEEAAYRLGGALLGEDIHALSGVLAHMTEESSDRQPRSSEPDPQALQEFAESFAWFEEFVDNVSTIQTPILDVALEGLDQAEDQRPNLGASFFESIARAMCSRTIFAGILIDTHNEPVVNPVEAIANHLLRESSSIVADRLLEAVRKSEISEKNADWYCAGFRRPLLLILGSYLGATDGVASARRHLSTQYGESPDTAFVAAKLEGSIRIFQQNDQGAMVLLSKFMKEELPQVDSVFYRAGILTAARVFATYLKMVEMTLSKLNK